MGDFFHSSQLLRYEKKKQFTTITGGIISLGIIIAITVGFAGMIVDTLNLQKINYSIQSQRRIFPKNTTIVMDSSKNYMFGIQVFKYNLSNPKRYFDVLAFADTWVNGKSFKNKTIPLQRCRQEHWLGFPELTQNLHELNVDGWLCPVIGTQIQISGKYTTTSYNMMTFQIYPCKNTTIPINTCASPQQINNFFQLHAGQLYFSYYYINAIINPAKPDFIDYYIQDQSYIIFGRQLGMESVLYVTDFTVNTDYSIWPYSSFQVHSGIIVNQPDRQRPYHISNQSAYMSFYVVKSAQSLHYERQVQKISAVFSFIGGLIGAVMASMFIIKEYTDFTFQISFANDLFKSSKNRQSLQETFNQDDQNIQLSNTSFYIYFKFLIFRFFKFIGKQVNWKDCIYLKQCLSQIYYQLDIKNLIQRIIFLQSSITKILQNDLAKQIKNYRPFKPQHFKTIKLKLKYADFQKDQQKQMAKQQQINKKSMILVEYINKQNNDLKKILQTQNKKHTIKFSKNKQQPYKQIQKNKKRQEIFYHSNIRMTQQKQQVPVIKIDSYQQQFNRNKQKQLTYKYKYSENQLTNKFQTNKI